MSEKPFQFTETRELDTVPGGKVTIITRRSGAVAVKLMNKRSKIFALYNKANLFNDDQVLKLEALEAAETVSYEHDMLRMKMAIHSWELPKEAFVIELEDLSLNEQNIELLSEDTWAEINKIISEFWEPTPKGTPEEQEEEAKNEQELSTNSPSPQSEE